MVNDRLFPKVPGSEREKEREQVQHQRGGQSRAQVSRIQILCGKCESGSELYKKNIGQTFNPNRVKTM